MDREPARVKLLFVVQRYGESVAAGAEAACRAFATRLADHGHEVEVATSCAVDYRTWANDLPPGESDDGGVTVHRFATDRVRDETFFGPLSSRVLLSDHVVPRHLQWRWIEAQGPLMPGLEPWLRREVERFDAVVPFTYLYFPALVATAVAHRVGVPVVLHPTAHDEPPLYLPIFRELMADATAFGFFTVEEEALCRRVFGVTQPGDAVGLGFDLPASSADPSIARAHLGLDDATPYLLYVGRQDSSKGVHELRDFFATYKLRNPGPLKLVVCGDPVQPPPPHPDLLNAGLVSSEVKASAIAGSVALVNPSYFESFSIVLLEAWAQRRPVLVQGRCDVLAGQVERAQGGLAFSGYAQFEEAVGWLLSDEAMARAAGEAGHRSTRERYSWSTVIDRYEKLLSAAAGA
jgi:glycosyltransferase involved in cell wall biosynthesis